MKFVRESLLEFERGMDPKHAMNTGIITQMKQDLAKLGYDQKEYVILPDLTIQSNKRTSRGWTDNKLNLISLKYQSPVQYEFVEKIKISTEIVVKSHNIDVKAAIDKALKDNISKEDIKKLLEKYAEKDVKNEGIIYLSKQTRNKEEEEYDEEYNIYAFIGFVEKVPVEGTKYFEDKLGTESIIKVDKFNTRDLQAISMMKIRARVQYPDGQVYIVHIPPQLMNNDRYKSIPKHCYDIFVKYKQKV